MLWLQKVHLPLSEVGQPYPGILQSGLLDLKINVQACVSAAKRGQLKIVELLLKYNADVNAYGTVQSKDI